MVPTRCPWNWDFGTGVQVLVSGSRYLMGGIHYAQVVDGSTRQQVGREGLIPTPWEVSWSMEGKCRSKIEMSVPKCRKMKFPELGLPGVENVPTPRGIILRAFPAPLRPKRAKINIFGVFGVRGWPPIGALTLV